MRKRTVAVLAAAWLALSPTVVAADPPAASDYRSTIAGVEPAAPTVHPSIVGGDSFFSLRVEPGTVVDVLGYQGEPYVRFLASGEVLENRDSITYHASRSRYGSTVPAGITATTPPRWRTVARDGRYAWHDHRTHWMNDFDPPGRRPGEVILEAAVPLLVDGRPTTVTVISTWQPPPSTAALWWGIGAGLAGLALVYARRRSATVVAAVTVGLAVVSGVVGGWQYWSVPPETGPSRLSIALPAVASIAGAAALAYRRVPIVAWAMIALAGVEVGIWAWLRRRHLTRAVLPTDCPFWIDRATTATAIVLVLTVVGLAGRRVVDLTRRP